MCVYIYIYTYIHIYIHILFVVLLLHKADRANLMTNASKSA